MGVRPNGDQRQDWNGVGGQVWVQTQSLLDRMFLPIEQALTTQVVSEPATAVLDVGCGTGATTLAVASRLGAGTRCTGVDVSAPMIDAARERAQRAGLKLQFVRPGRRANPCICRWGIRRCAVPIWCDVFR